MSRRQVGHDGGQGLARARGHGQRLRPQGDRDGLARRDRLRLDADARAGGRAAPSAVRSVPSRRFTRAGRKATRVGAGSTGAVSTHARRDLAAGPGADQLRGPVGTQAREAELLALLETRAASERSARRWAVRRMLTGSKIADSTMTSVVASETSDVAPPMTPATASGPAGSAMSSVSGGQLAVDVVQRLEPLPGPRRAARGSSRARRGRP